jgi:PAS domain-containing protein
LIRRIPVPLRWAWAALVAVQALTAGLVVWNARVQAARHQRAALDNLLEVASPLASAACFTLDPSLAEQITRSLAAGPGIRTATLRAPGEVLAQARGPSDSRRPILISRKLFSPFNAEFQVGELCLEAAPGEAAQVTAPLGAGLLVLAALGGLALAWVGERWVARPRDALAAALEAVKPEPGAAPLPPGGPGAAPVTAALNGLLERFQAALETLRRERDDREEARRSTQAMLDNAGAGLFVLRGNGTLAAWSQGLVERVEPGGSPPALGMALEALFPQERESVKACVEACLRGPGPAARWMRASAPGSTVPRWMRLSLRPIGPDWIQGHLQEASLEPGIPGPAGPSLETGTGRLDRQGAERLILDHLANDLDGMALLAMILEDCAAALLPHLEGAERMADLGKGEYLLILPGEAGSARARAEALVGTLRPESRLRARVAVIVQDPLEEPSRASLLRRASQALARAGQGEPGIWEF